MIDRIIKLLSWCLGILLILLAGAFIALLNEEANPSVSAPAPPPRAEAAPPKMNQNSSDLTTKRVKTIIVRPEDLSSTSGNP